MLRIQCLALVAVVGCAGLELVSVRAAWAANVAPLTLQDAIHRALANAPAAAAAVAQSDLDAARVREAGAPWWPTVAGLGEYNQAPGYSKAVSNGGLTQAQLALDYTAFDGGRRASELRAARYAADASRLGVNVARAQVVFETTVAYFDLVHAHESVRELERSIARLTQYVVIVENLQHSGRAIANDVLKLRTTRDGSELALASTVQAVSHAGIVLDALLGASGSAELRLPEIGELPPPPSGDIVKSPVFQVAQRRLDAAAAGVDAAQAERMPTFKLALTSGWQGINPPHTFDHNLGASYDGAINVPIFAGGLVQAHIDEARAAQQLALAQIRATQLSLKRDLADAVASYQGARRRLDLLAGAQTTADDAFALTWTRFLGGGNVTLLEVTDAYLQAESLRVARLDDEFLARQAAAEAALVLGVDS
jgi:outer membrane protein TolC